MLESEPLMAHLGTCVEGRPHVASVWYRYAADEGVVVIVTTGRKLANSRENPACRSRAGRRGGRTRWMVTLLERATTVEDEERTAATRR